MTGSALGIWLSAARPKTLWAAITPVIIGTALAFYADAVHGPSALAALCGAVMIQIGTNFANDYYDFVQGVDTADRLGPTRATQAGLVTPSQMKRAFIIAFSLAFVAGIYLVTRGGWPIVAIGLLSILFGVLYTAGPYPLAYHGWADLFVLIFFGPVAVGGTYYVQTHAITTEAILMGLGTGLFSTAILTVNNLRDIQTDTRAGRKTLAVRFGARFARAEYLVCLALAALIPIVVSFQYRLPWGILLTLLVIPLTVPTVRLVLSKEGKILNQALAGTGRALLLYGLLFSVGLLV